MKMTWCKSGGDDDGDRMVGELPASPAGSIGKSTLSIIKSCPSCGHRIQQLAASCIQDLPGLPAGVKFDPTDQELLDHLEGKARPESQKHHPLVDEFIPTIEGENGICYTHPEKLPGVNRDGLIRHFFHRPSKAYTTGTRKRRKVHTDVEGGETRWHKTGKTRPVCAGGMLKGYKKILVLYTNYGKQRKPEKTNWVMHQYHLGSDEEEKDGELVVSKVFYQTQPRQCSSSMKDAVAVVQGDRMKGTTLSGDNNNNNNNNNTVFKDGRSISGYYGASSLTPLNQAGHSSEPRLLHNFAMHAGGTTSFLSLDQ